MSTMHPVRRISLSLALVCLVTATVLFVRLAGAEARALEAAGRDADAVAGRAAAAIGSLLVFQDADGALETVKDLVPGPRLMSIVILNRAGLPAAVWQAPTAGEASVARAAVSYDGNRDRHARPRTFARAGTRRGGPGTPQLPRRGHRPRRVRDRGRCSAGARSPEEAHEGGVHGARAPHGRARRARRLGRRGGRSPSARAEGPALRRRHAVGARPPRSGPADDPREDRARRAAARHPPGSRLPRRAPAPERDLRDLAAPPGRSCPRLRRLGRAVRNRTRGHPSRIHDAAARACGRGASPRRDTRRPGRLSLGRVPRDLRAARDRRLLDDSHRDGRRSRARHTERSPARDEAARACRRGPSFERGLARGDRHRAAPARRAARVSGALRLTDGSPEPVFIRRKPAKGRFAVRGKRGPGGPRVRRSRPLQAGQRHVRARGWRRAAARGRVPAFERARQRRCARAHGRGRVLRGSDGAVRRGDRRPASSGADPRRSQGAVRPAWRGGVRRSQRRRERVPGRRARRRRAAEARGRRDVRREEPRRERLPGVRARRDARRRRAPAAGERSPQGSRPGRARDRLPAAGGSRRTS